MRYHEILPETSDILTLNPGETRPAPIAARPEDQSKALDLMSQITDLEQELKNLARLRDEMYYKTDKWLRDNQYRYESDTVKNFQKEIDDISAKHIATSEKIDSLSKDYTFLIKGNDDPDAGALRAYEHLKEHCSDFLNKSSQAQKLLYRGLQKYPSSFRGFSFIGRSWDKRYTKDTPRQTHEKLSAVMRENGFTATRENSIMCTSSYPTAEEYGEVYMIFPINGFSFTWSRTYADMFTDLFDKLPYYPAYSGHWSALMNHFDDTYGGAQGDEQQKRSIESNFIKNELKLNRTDFHAALLSGHEIYIHGQYYALHLRAYWQLNQLLKSNFGVGY